MARPRRSLLPPVTDADLRTRPHDLRRTAHGWAWKCAYCGQFASSETQAGRYVCRSHGGVTARQRDLQKAGYDIPEHPASTEEISKARTPH